MPDTRQPSFTATLRLRDRRLARRLEGFGEIVFGFAVSQCALQLPTDHGHVDLSRLLALLMYFLTFAGIVSLWMIFHRLMSGAFVPSGVDLLAAFAHLAFVSLVPYAISHEVVGRKPPHRGFRQRRSAPPPRGKAYK